MIGYQFRCEHVFYTLFRKHYCPVCKNKLKRKKVSEIVNANAPEAKNCDFEVAGITVKGDMKFTHIAFSCEVCGREYSVQEARRNRF